MNREERRKFRQQLNSLTTTPGERFVNWLIKWIAIIGGGWILLEILSNMPKK